MLYVLYRYDKIVGEREWHVGEPVPDIPVENVYGIEADGAEADHIDEMMGGAINRVITKYYGDLARTIFLNLGGEVFDRD